MSRKKLILIVPLSVIAPLILSAWSPWDSFRYHGDGKFSDKGFFSYQRYVVTFPDMPLKSPNRKLQIHIDDTAFGRSRPAADASREANGAVVACWLR